jgi:hypothetical protein
MAHSQAYRRDTPQKQRYEMAAGEAGSAENCDAAGHYTSLWRIFTPGLLA